MKYTILVDKREKTPLPFPAELWTVVPRTNPSDRKVQSVSLLVKKETLETADYLLDGAPPTCYALGDGSGKKHMVAIETKRSMREIASQTLTDKTRARLARALDRLAGESYRPLVIFERPSGSEPAVSEDDAVVAMDTFLRLLLERDLPSIIVASNTLAQRRKTAELVARFLIQGSLQGR